LKNVSACYPKSLWIGKSWDNVRESLFFEVTLDPETSLLSTQIAPSQGIPSQIRVEVTGMYFDLHSLML
jgi:hypothetical protein